MFGKLLLSFVTVGVLIAGAAPKRYHVQIFQDSVVNGKSIKAGDYTIEMQNDTAVIMKGKQTIEVPAHTESVTNKFDSTALEYTGNDLEDIRVGGSRTKIVFGAANTTAGEAE